MPTRPWANSPRPRGVDRTTRIRILRRDNAICHYCGQPGAGQVDHVIPWAEGGPDTDNNLAPIHKTPCHLKKTLAEAARGRARRSPTRPQEPHPGLR